jgi:hypothetical protein
LDERVAFHQKLNLTYQPFIVVLGSAVNVREIFIRVEDTNYKIPSVREAVDSLFKLFFVFNLQYPFAGTPIWLFFQLFFF